MVIGVSVALLLLTVSTFVAVAVGLFVKLMSASRLESCFKSIFVDFVDFVDCSGVGMAGIKKR